MKVTDWLKGAERPVRPGVYQRLYRTGCILYCRFDARGWCSGFETVPEAVSWPHQAIDQDLPWRGVAKEWKK